MNKERSVFLTNRKCEWKTKKVWMNRAQSWKYKLVEKIGSYLTMNPITPMIITFGSFFSWLDLKKNQKVKRKKPVSFAKTSIFSNFYCIPIFYVHFMRSVTNFFLPSCNDPSMKSTIALLSTTFQLFGSMHILLIVSFFFFAGRRDIVLCVGLHRAGTGQGPSPYDRAQCWACTT